MGLVVEDDTWCRIGKAGKWWHIIVLIAALSALNYADVDVFDGGSWFGGSWFGGHGIDATAWFQGPLDGISWQIEVWDVWAAGVAI